MSTSTPWVMADARAPSAIAEAGTWLDAGTWVDAAVSAHAHARPQSERRDAGSAARDAAASHAAESASAMVPSGGPAHEHARDGGSPDVSPTVSSGIVPVISEPQRIGILVGPGHAPEGLTLHGTDLGFPVSQADDVLLFFGDTTEAPTDLCADQGDDDMLASIPARFEGEVPTLDVARSPEDPKHFEPVHLLQQGQPLTLNAGRVPVGGFRYGEDVYMLFNRLSLARCDPGAERPGCAGNPAFRCVGDIGECAPNRSVVVPPLCDQDTGAGCMLDQRCEPASEGFCVDPTSSQFDETHAGKIAAVVHLLDLGKRRADEPTLFDRVGTFQTSKFLNPSVVQIKAWTGRREGNDYAPGEGALLVWGRPGFTGDGPREARLYLMALPLPLKAAADGTLAWTPNYFAGIERDEPRWTQDQAEAKPLSLDGSVDGDPHEEVTLVNQTSISFVGGTVNKWVMLYGGDVSDLLVQNAAAVRTGPAPGSIMLRVANHPWGPFSAPVAHLSPGSPERGGDAYGPGGILYHPNCRDTANARCAPANGAVNLLQCVQTTALVDPGRLYGAMILPSYTRDNASGGMDMFWNVSTWNPYGVVMFKTSLGPRH